MEKSLKRLFLMQFTITYAKISFLPPKQSGFRPGDSTVNQLIAITHQIHTASENFPSHETRAVFLYISKAFEKVWHGGLLVKLKSSGIFGDLLQLIQSFLSGRQQRVVLNSKNSEWHYITAGAPGFCGGSTVLFSLH